MSFMAKNPISAAQVSSTPPTPIKGARGLFAKEDGWYDIDDEGNVSKLGINSEEDETQDIYIQEDEPVDAPEGSLWVDVDDTLGTLPKAEEATF